MWNKASWYSQSLKLYHQVFIEHLQQNFLRKSLANFSSKLITFLFLSKSYIKTETEN
jgi:hypothetical protein